MNAKRRRLLKWSLFSAASLATFGAITWRTLGRDKPVSEEGLVPGVEDALAQAIPAGAPVPRFERVDLPFRHFPGTRTHRLPEDMGSGIAVADLDGDGLVDMFLVNAGPLGGTQPPCEIYRNLGGFRFERVETPLPRLLGMGVAVGDYDGDGRFDVYVTGYGRNVLLHNEGALRFTDVTASAGVAGGGFSAGAVFGDADGDGRLDLYVTRYVAFDEALSSEPSRRGSASLPATLNPATFPPERNLLFRNLGDGRFDEIAEALGVANPRGKSLGAAFADLDGDGVEDIYVVNDVSDNALFRGRRGEPFEDATYSSCTADWRGAMGLAVGDPLRRGELDLFITHWQTEENTLYVKEPGRLVFRDASMQTYLGPPGRGRVGWACDFGDFDDDGRPDVFVVNGSTFEQESDTTRLVPQRLQLFWNAGERFFDLASRAGPVLDVPVVGRAGVVADLDGDGRVDWIVGVHGGSPLVLRNVTESSGHHLVVDVRSGPPNRFGVGARVTVASGGSVETQEVGTRVSYLSCGPLALHFGLGPASSAERVTVRFPSGKVVVRERVTADRRIVVDERDDSAPVEAAAALPSSEAPPLVRPRTGGATVRAAPMGSRLDAIGDALAAGRTTEAEAGLRSILREDPVHPGALYRLAQLTPIDEALGLLDRLAAVEPRSPRAQLLRAQRLSDPRRPDAFDLDAASAAVARAREINPDETGVGFEEGRLLLLRGRPGAAAVVLERVRQNPRAAALAALCHLRAGDAVAATRLLGRTPGSGVPHMDEGDTASKRMLDRDLLARLLDLGPDPRWRTTRLPLAASDGSSCAFEDIDGDGHLDARVGARVVRLKGLEVLAELESRAPPARPRSAFEVYDFDAAARFALDPPERVVGPPPGATAVVEADVDGDGRLDLVVACGGDDPAAPLPWWVLLRDGSHYRPVRGAIPEPGYRVAAIAVADLDGDGIAEILLKGGGFLPGDAGPSFIASFQPPP